MIKEERRKKRHLRVRKKIFGSKDIPRVVVFKSNKYIYASLVVDEEYPNRVLMTVSGTSPEIRQSGEKVKGYNAAGAVQVGKLLAKKSLEKGISKVVFDRSGYKYTGRVKALADAAREGGLKF
ncbi:MAG: 50S ribosomal protein L18 [Candidatus Omnitrophica bacterium]|nr:50S ribosomal protein L18 [Candidatus Omnitrophota bacterium]